MGCKVSLMVWTRLALAEPRAWADHGSTKTFVPASPSLRTSTVNSSSTGPVRNLSALPLPSSMACCSAVRMAATVSPSSAHGSCDTFPPKPE